MMKLSRARAQELMGAISQLVPNDRNRESVPKDIAPSVNYGLGRNLSRLRVINQETNDESERVAKQQQDLAIEYCEKDVDGKPVVIGEGYAGLTYGANKKYDDASSLIAKEHKEYMRQEIDFDDYHIKGQLPKGTAIWALLCDFFDEPSPDAK